MKAKESYLQIFKSSGLFGGVQIFTIIGGIIRTKIVAVLLGASGVGTIGLLQSTINLISSITSLGLNYSAIKELSEVNSTGDINKISRTIVIFKRLVSISSFVGMSVLIIFASRLSYFTFGDGSHNIDFIWLSSVLLLNTLANGHRTILQGTRKLGDLGKSIVFGTGLSLFVSLPCYYFFNMDGIVPSLILTALVSYIVSYYYFRNIKISIVYIRLVDIFKEGHTMLKLGSAMTISAIAASSSAYFLNSFINYIGGIEEVGFYNAGWGIIGQYTYVIFTSMTMDFYPRLSEINKDNRQVNTLVNQQTEMVLLITVPLLLLLLLTLPLVIKLFYTSKFLVVIDYASWTVLGTLLRAPASVFSYVFLAKSNVKLYTRIEVSLFVIFLSSNILGYYYSGLEGLGITYVINYFLYTLVYYFFCKKNYGVTINRSSKVIFAISFTVISISLVISRLENTLFLNILSILLVFLFTLYSLSEINKRIDLKEVFKKYLRIFDK